jgi:hypothetical protein
LSGFFISPAMRLWAFSAVPMALFHVHHFQVQDARFV